MSDHIRITVVEQVRFGIRVDVPTAGAFVFTILNTRTLEGDRRQPDLGREQGPAIGAPENELIGWIGDIPTLPTRAQHLGR